MDELGLGSPEGASLPGMRDDNINISDVIEVIETDPDFTQSSNMFNGGSEIPQPTTLPSMAPVRASKRLVKIIEQPASKALRFRYECEGRSAGSIPGISSTPENKTFPAIQIMGYQGRAVVVVSCVTKDAPHRPHPHNLVGREGCKKGVCTLEVSPETMSVTFSNLGIQCVKKKDIESALKVREEIRVDPFRTGFQHRNQPTTIDLNAVRLCFQVFLEGDQRGKFTVPLTPVISEPIYDKKAMCDLIIIKLSDCVSSVDGGRKDIILLCEKVAKEDIQIRFYEERDGQLVWEGLGDFQPSQVHKQTAIWFRAPRYKTLDVTEPVKVYIQLRRPSDGATSEPLPFELLPLDSGRPAFWSFRRNLAKKGNYNLFSTILANDARLVAKRQLSNNNMSPPLPPQNGKDGVDSSQNVLDTDVEMVGVTQLSDKPEQTQGALEWCDYSEVGKRSKEPEPQVSEEKSFNELINQVAELDEIYSESRARSNLDEAFDQEKVMRDESFDDARTYTSLQLAFKNPLELDISDKDKYEDVTIVNPQGPIIDVSSLKRENELDKLPPLPPKRAKKVTDICDPYIPNVTTGSTRSIQMTVKQTEAGNNPCVIGKPVGRSSSFSLPRPRSQSEVPLPPGKKLPPTPCSTLPNPKKKSFFSKLFSRKKDKWSTQSLDAIKPDSRHSLTTSKIMLLGGSPSAARGSTGSVAAHSVHSNTDSIGPHSLMQDNATNFNENNSSEDVTNKTINNTDLNANDDLNMNLDLTEAEHYALYMAMAPHATQSEFDEMSSYYSPVEGEPGLLKRKRQKYESDPKSHVLLQLQEQESNRAHSYMLNIPMEMVKTEPRDTTPSPYGGQMYGGISPMYTPNSALSPQQQYRVPMDPTSPPADLQLQFNSRLVGAASAMGVTVLPPINNMLPQNWNIPNSSVAEMQNNLGSSSAMNIDTPSGLSSLLDLDSQQLELKQINLNSGELASLNSFDPNNLSENLCNNLSLTDIQISLQTNQNMTDSLTRLANNTIDSICQLNDMYKQN